MKILLLFILTLLISPQQEQAGFILRTPGGNVVLETGPITHKQVFEDLGDKFPEQDCRIVRLDGTIADPKSTEMLQGEHSLVHSPLYIQELMRKDKLQIQQTDFECLLIKCGHLEYQVGLSLGHKPESGTFELITDLNEMQEIRVLNIQTKTERSVPEDSVKLQSLPTLKALVSAILFVSEIKKNIRNDYPQDSAERIMAIDRICLLLSLVDRKEQVKFRSFISHIGSQFYMDCFDFLRYNSIISVDEYDYGIQLVKTAELIKLSLSNYYHGNPRWFVEWTIDTIFRDESRNPDSNSSEVSAGIVQALCELILENSSSLDPENRLTDVDQDLVKLWIETLL